MRHEIVKTALFAAVSVGLCYSFCATAGTSTQPAGKAPAKPAAARIARPADGRPAAQPVANTTVPASRSTSQKAVWNSVTVGFAEARRLHKPIITDFYTDWCGWCKHMDEVTFKNPQVEKLMAENFVLVRANAEDKADGQQLASKSHIQGFPTVAIYDWQGKQKTALVGFKEPGVFTQALNDFLAGKDVADSE